MTQILRLFKVFYKIFICLAEHSEKTFQTTIGDSERQAPSLLQSREGASQYKSLTMTYFHTGICTIIGAKSFHCPVRDGKEWDQLAMVVRHNGLLS